jgi:hypothetical protein
MQNIDPLKECGKNKVYNFTKDSDEERQQNNEHC